MLLLISSLIGMLVQSNGINMNEWRLSTTEKYTMRVHRMRINQVCPLSVAAAAASATGTAAAARVATAIMKMVYTFVVSSR